MPENTSRRPDLRAVIEDNALQSVPLDQRQSGWALFANTAGVGSTLVVLGVGAAVTFTAGTRWGLVVALVAAVFGSGIGWAVGRICQATGTSSTVTARFHGLGTRGSALASLVFAFMILGFLALENALLYYGTIFMFGWEPSTANKLGIYGVLTVAWIVLTTFGLGLVQKVSLLLTVVCGVLFVVVTIVALDKSSVSLGDVWSYSPPGVGFTEITAALSIIAGIAGALALVGADFSRYARTSGDVRVLAVGGAIVVNIVVVAIGTIVFQAGNLVVAEHLADPTNAAQAASQVGATIPEKIAFMSSANPGAYFIVLSGFLGFLVMYAAQAKAQVLNTYSGSLALSNLSDAVFGRSPGRLVMVVLGNVIALLAIWGDILDRINSFLGLLGILTTALCALMITDFFVVRRGAAHRERVEQFNWAGIVAMLASSALAYWLQDSGRTNLGFLIALVLCPLLYVALRSSLLPEGRGTGTVEASAALELAE
ncbi:purine-cytosine permease family protein [Nocardioides nitrophenolicus]|uniref:purine-cytosine permease family protein n=1 Tax=Nocardioides nitrophenolicus TaxID=60489 RepID=UPI00195993AE|nr:cytosine permease [Nocardioides nitrophenolicus]MBM7519749.1 cytosine permease [Nocardioides nitrophenolicus]